MTNANVIFGNEVQKVFTEVVNEYLAQGMTYHLSSMSGSQGEIAKVDVTDGQDVYRIRLEHGTHFGDWKDENDFRGDIMELVVEKFVGEYDAEVSKHSRTLWSGKGEEVSSRIWYQISNRGKAVFVNSIEEARDCQKVKNERCIRRGNTNLWKTSVEDIRISKEEQLVKVRDMCRTHRGYGKVKKAHIDRIVKTVWTDAISYKVMFTAECGKDALVIKQVKVNK